MDTNTTIQQNQNLLIWHKPQLRRLIVSLDTANGGGSIGDGGTGSPGIAGTGTTVAVPSDRRLKREITKLNDALQAVLSLNGVTYHYDTANHPEMGRSDKPQIGFIAQELEEVYPQLVLTKENGYKAVNYAPMVAVLVEAIKEQQAMIEDLQRQVNRIQEKSKKTTN